MNVIIRPYRPEDDAAVSLITYRTGFKGEDLSGRRYFDDRRLFFLLFIYYYTRYEQQHFFVAEEVDSGEVAGYICGSPDSARKEKQFVRRMGWRVWLRIISVTLWRYPRTLKTFWVMTRMFRTLNSEDRTELYKEYPAHLHINLLPDYQGCGLGTRLIQHFERHLIDLDACGVNLGTTNYNHKALPFYEKLGYKVYRRTPMQHPTLRGLEELIFVKRLKYKRPIAGDARETSPALK